LFRPKVAIFKSLKFQSIPFDHSLDLTGGKILFCFFFKNKKDLEGRQEYGFQKMPKRFASKQKKRTN
jgi:hypothetical protein